MGRRSNRQLRGGCRGVTRSPEQDPEGEGLLGIYEGISLSERAGDYWGAMPDRITIFRQPHLDLL